MKKTNKKIFLSFLLIVLMLVSLTACSSQQQNDSSQKGEEKIAEIQLRLGTTNVGGTYYLMGTAYSQTMSKFQPDVKLNVEVTGGAVDNLKLLANGDIDLGMAFAVVTKQAVEGVGPFKKPTQYRALTAVNLGRQHIITAKGSGIKTLRDLKGKRVSTGEPGNSAEIVAAATLEAVGIDIDKDIIRQRSNLTDTMDAIADGRCDAAFYTAGIGVPSIVEATTTSDKAVLIGIDEETIDKIVSKYSHFVKTEIPKGAYGNNEVLPTIGAANHLLTTPDLPEEVAYKIVSTLFENRDDWINAHSSGQEQTLEFAVKGSPVDYHSGALRYYKEKGVIK
ncbi:MAG: TAXI family TRAP transporter solute-binding subunit [Peptococcaceae bacterium]